MTASLWMSYERMVRCTLKTCLPHCRRILLAGKRAASATCLATSSTRSDPKIVTQAVLAVIPSFIGTVGARARRAWSVALSIHTPRQSPHAWTKGAPGAGSVGRRHIGP